MPASRRVLAVLAVLAASLAAGLLSAVPAAARPAADPRPTAVVALGDSTASGEGAEDYEPGTRGENGNWCHRSPAAYVHRTGLADESVNLACSGADTAHVRFGAATRYTEGSQAERLVEVATRYRVTAVTLQIGANDDAALTATAIACIRTFVDPTVGPCRNTVGPRLPDRMAALTPKVEATVADVRTAMRRAGYADDGYAFVLASYASPVTEKMGRLHGVEGCPYSRADAEWGRTIMFPELSATLGGVADRTGIRFLDLSRATEGYEACSRPTRDAEWQRRITVDPRALVYGRLDAIGLHLFQESFHPSAAGHAQIGGCLGEFVRGGEQRGLCLVGADGRLHATTATPAPATA
ncbi:GDSL-type esterase/lipase family protein [Pseudonocardia sp. H11422]|uniref:GDSL-type esterase/lipase family protein n=1 Tax=Pseudonocardia sp. H11422 TaxID=2835866 RepID=UPI0027E2ABF1|nr:GDSL-type esterase/lipase family protein [Pseudonocardia sp. H11422]